MNPDEFHILLPSTASLEEFPHNTSNQYKVRLLQQLRLSDNQLFSPWVGIDLEFALKMEWIKKKLDGRTYVLGPNLLVHSRTFSTDPQVLGVLVNAKREPVLWQVNEYQQVILSGQCNWRFINLNTAFRNIGGDPH